MNGADRENLMMELRAIRRTVEAQNELLRQFVGVQEYLTEGTDAGLPED